MRIILSLMLIILAGCVEIEPETFTPPPQVDDRVEEEQVDNSVPQEEARPVEVAVNDEGFERWRENTVGATMLVSDGDKAARLYLRQGETAPLNTEPPVNVTIIRVGSDGKIQLSVNEETAIMEAREDRQFLDGNIIIFLDDVFT